MNTFVSNLVAVVSLVFASGCLEGQTCDEEDGEGEEVASAEQSLASAGDAPPAADPVTLIARCSALPGADKQDILGCMAAVAPSHVPGALINACKSLGLTMFDQQRCFEAGALSATPGAVLKACKLGFVHTGARLLCLQTVARSSKPDLLVPSCTAEFPPEQNGDIYDLQGPVWECLQNGSLSPAPDVLVDRCSTTSDRRLCIKSAAPSPKPDVIIAACKTLTFQSLAFSSCLSGAAQSAHPEVLVSSCSALPGLSAPGVVKCLNYAGRSPTPDLLIEACENAGAFGSEDRIACIQAAVGVDTVYFKSGAGAL